MGKYVASNYADVNGVRIHYAAEGDGKSILLVHGNGESHSLFDTEIGQLVRAGYKVFAPDSRGHGANEPEAEYHYADMAEDMYQLIMHLGLKKPAFYGHSDGGIIGLMLEIMHPGTLGIMAVSGTNLSPEGLSPAFLEECANLNREKPDPLITLMLNEPDIKPEELRAIKIPVLVTAGENDLIRRPETELIASSLPDSKLVIVDGADHGSYVGNSEAMGEMLIEFLRERG